MWYKGIKVIKMKLKIKITKKTVVPIVSAFAALLTVFLFVAFWESSPATKPTGNFTPTTHAAPATAATEAAKPQTLKMSFIGDCVIGGDPIDYGEESFIWFSENYPPDYFFEKVRSELSKDDFTLANLECVLSDNLQLEAVDKGYEPAFWFRAKAKNAQILTEGSVEVAGVVNNHTYDFGDEGYADTVKALEDTGLLVGEDCQPIYFEKNGIKVGVVYANLWGYYQESYIEDALKEMQDKCDYKIVFFHGGEEGQHEPDNFKIDACRDLAASGLCDLIVGSHPHVLQPLEVVNGVPVFYSLGNFCYAGNNYPENKTVIFGVTLKKDDRGSISAETDIIPCYVYTGAYNTFQPAVITDEADKKEILDMLSAKVDYITETEPQADVTTAEETTPTEAFTQEETEELSQDNILDETESPSASGSQSGELSDNSEEIETAVSYY